LIKIIKLQLYHFGGFFFLRKVRQKRNVIWKKEKVPPIWPHYQFQLNIWIAFLLIRESNCHFFTSSLSLCCVCVRMCGRKCVCVCVCDGFHLPKTFFSFALSIGVTWPNGQHVSNPGNLGTRRHAPYLRLPQTFFFFFSEFDQKNSQAMKSGKSPLCFVFILRCILITTQCFTNLCKLNLFMVVRCEQFVPCKI